MSIDNINAEICENIISVINTTITYDIAKQDHKKVKTSLAVKNLKNTISCIRVRV